MTAPLPQRLKASVFKSNRSQAVRLPKAAAFPDDVKEVWVLRKGKSLLLVPLESLWDDFFAEPGIDIREPEDPIDDSPAAQFD
ncbi:MAG TPA: type II toxin-antitoxin system VapB family antitoxin [Brevundimonas sp.]|jgi:antitoxin VapB|uniref:type II toxin-antitoxin system VapB family antitoxin n=1 Tax=Brevundimonas sp. TaxID=1871086 RepID=UPI002CC1AC4D|nr:type II toxin-antitoxin system VapB family antitoxin [Brevundimonas sp.]HRH21046.1 type II toxin-antitoxin system VapB family antitoxin [Brevundimonas sp.]